MPDLHHALRVEPIRDAQHETVAFNLVRLTYGTLMENELPGSQLTCNP